MNFIVQACYLYPVKSCAGVAVDRLTFDESGQIAGDRAWVVVDDQGCMTWMGAMPRLALVRPQHLGRGWALQSPHQEAIALPPAGEGATCTVQAWNGTREAFDALAGRDAGDAVAAFVSDVVGRKVRVAWLETVQHRPNPVHLTTGSSLQALAAHLGVSTGQMAGHRRFRPNVVLDSEPGETGTAFAEESVAAFTRPPFRLEVTERCARCLMVDVDPETGTTQGRYFAGVKAHSARRAPGQPAYFGVYARAGRPGSLGIGDVLMAEGRQLDGVA